MDHKDAVRLQATERYLLNELDPDQLDQFEEHLFECQECALDVRAAAMLVEQSKAVLSQKPQAANAQVPAPRRKGWLGWLRPAFALPVMALMVFVIGYQNLIVFPGRRQPARMQVFPLATINVATRSGASPAVHTKRGEAFLLLVNIPAENRYASYVADLYDPAGSIKWSVPIAAEAANDAVPVRVPGQTESGIYTLAVRGLLQDGKPMEIGRQPFEVRLQ